MTATVTVGIWIALAIVAASLQAAGVTTRHRFPGFGDVAGHVMQWWVGRFLVLSGWVWLGWHVFVRSHPG